MIREYIENRLGPVTDEEFNLSCAVVKNYILGELGGIRCLNRCYVK